MTLYLTLLLGKVLPASLRRVVYIDADCIVRRDPKHLFELTLTEPVAACGDFGTPFIGSADLLLSWKSLGMEGTAKYFNLGLLVIDLDAWRADATQDQLLQIARRYGDDLDWLNQDVFNLALYGRWMEPSPTWNAC